MEWIKTVEGASLLAVGFTYSMELEGAWSAAASGGSSQGIASPVYSLVTTVARFFYEGGIPIVIPLVPGVLGIAALSFMRTGGQAILFESPATTFLLGPVAVIALAGLTGLALWAMMQAGLFLLGQFTDLAASATGATGIAGFCFYCLGELGKKGMEEVLTPSMPEIRGQTFRPAAWARLRRLTCGRGPI